jgi:hypothetical protein
MTQQQSAAIERVYVESLPARQRAVEEVIGLSEDIATRLHDGLYDDEQLQLTAKLAGALTKQRELRRRTFELSVQVLTPPQRDKLTRLIADKRLIQ